MHMSDAYLTSNPTMQKNHPDLTWRQLAQVFSQAHSKRKQVQFEGWYKISQSEYPGMKTFLRKADLIDSSPSRGAA